MWSSSLAWGTYDNDSRLDFQINGFDGGSYVSRLYHNAGTALNIVPSAPLNLHATALTTSTVQLTWDVTSDPQTAAAGLNYNLRITPGGNEVVAPLANGANGQRRVAQRGSVQTRYIVLTGLHPATTYYWSVQALDPTLAGGEFATELTFQLGSTPTATPTVPPALSNTPTPTVIPASTVLAGSPTPTATPAAPQQARERRSPPARQLRHRRSLRGVPQ